MSLKWKCDDETESTVDYSLSIGEDVDGRTPIIADEQLSLSLRSGQHKLISTAEKGERRLHVTRNKEPVPLRLSGRSSCWERRSRGTRPDPTGPYLGALRQFWNDAVFLRLSPMELAKTSPLKRDICPAS